MGATKVNEETKPKKPRGVKVRITVHHGKRFDLRFYRDDVLTLPKAQAEALIDDGVAVKA